MPDEKTRHMQAAGYLHEQHARLAADLASIGDAGVTLVTHLQHAGGVMTGAELAHKLDDMSRFALSRLVKRCMDAGIVRKPDRFTVELCQDWAENLEESVKQMATYADGAIAKAKHLDTSAQYQTARLDQAQEIAETPSDKTTFATMQVRILAIKRTLETLAALRLELIVWAAETLSVSHPHKAARIFKTYASKDAHAAADLRNRATAGRRRLHSTETAAAMRASFYQRQNMAPWQIEQALTADGFSRHSIGAVTL